MFRPVQLVKATTVLLLAQAAAHAHIVLAVPEAAAGSSYVAAFRISHACGTSPTVKLRIEIPETIFSVHPQPKAGWKLSVERLPLAQPAKGEGGEVRDRISAVVWEGRLEAEYFDEFPALLRLPTTTGLLYFPATQTCATGENRWVEIPAAGKAWTSVPKPAPVLSIVRGQPLVSATNVAPPATTANAPTVLIADPESRPTPPFATVGVAYLSMINRGTTADRLLSASSPVAGRVELHATTTQGNVARMRPVENLELPPNRTVTLQPLGMHLMLFDLKAPLVAGQSFPLTLKFREAGEITVDVSVQTEGASPDASSHDHH